jgi:receptor protein-tyrosine kinase
MDQRMPNDSAVSHATDRLSLIERAAERLHAQRAEGRPLTGEPAVARPASEARAANRPDPIPEADAAAVGQRTIELDYRRLAALGHITPDTMTTHLAEEIRLIKRSLLNVVRSSADSRRNVVLVSSADPGAGKSFLSLNLALSIACEYDTGALLVDADTERPQIFERLGAAEGTGLLDLLADPGLDVGEAVVATDLDRLSLIGPGRGSDFASELLGSNRMQEVVDQLQSRYPDRLLILDSAPLLACAGSTELTRWAGQVLFVVEADRTERAAIDAALDLIPDDCQVQLVLNKNRARASMRAPYYGYGRRRDRLAQAPDAAPAQTGGRDPRHTVPPTGAGRDVS